MTKKIVAITGINGFVGAHLTRELNNQGFEVIGIGREDDLNPKISALVKKYHKTDLTKSWPEDIEDVHGIIHLSGLAAVGPSYDDPQLYINANSAMVTHLCEFYVKKSNKPRILLISSGAIYDSQQPMPINEDSPISFSSPYAVSKVLNENQAEYYRRRGLDCVIARPFTHIGPGQREGFLLPDLYSKIMSLSEGDNTINVGNLNTKRDYTDVRDIARAYVAIISAEKDLEHRIYNVSSGESISGVDMLNNLKQVIDQNNVDYKIDPDLVRPTDIMDIIGDSSRLQKELGWKPEISVKQTIKDFVDSK